jgi:hypothetical protein
MSALPPKADIPAAAMNVRFGPFSDKVHRSKIVLFPRQRFAYNATALNQSTQAAKDFLSQTFKLK